MAEYIIRDREAGNEIEIASSEEEAKKIIAAYEEEDRKDGTYTPDFYEFVEILDDKETLEKIINSESWDEVIEEIECLARKYDIPLKDEDGEWKNGDQMLKDILAHTIKQ